MTMIKNKSENYSKKQ